MPVAIEARNISKRFFLGERNQRAFFEDVATKTMRGIRRLLRPGETSKEKVSSRHFWALRDVSFQVPQGQTLAIIGENGAGKSTLLKILSRITQPTTGTVKVYGRLASLLEVGTGFHPEFSGRDNIYLNGAMLGLSRREVRDRFDRIVDFSGLEQFIDMPVKNYSSGMYVRLAFSVAAHLNPEIVILDEVLAVGDAAFQKKCFDRMEEIIGEGHAAILVSHSMGNVRRMSQICMWLRHGRMEMLGPTYEVASQYEKQTAHEMVSGSERNTTPQDSAPQPMARLCAWHVAGKSAAGQHAIFSGQESVRVQLTIELLVAVANGKLAVSIADVQGLVLSTHEGELRQAEIGKLEVVLELQSLPINPGEYIISCSISGENHPIAFLRANPELTVLEERDGGHSGYHGILNLPAKLHLQESGALLTSR
jgi:lipopolysaccharide transport system ATP-binding protein